MSVWLLVKPRESEDLYSFNLAFIFLVLMHAVLGSKARIDSKSCDV